MLSRKSCSQACSRDNSSFSSKCLGKYKVPRPGDVGFHEGYWLRTVEGFQRAVHVSGMINEMQEKGTELPALSETNELPCAA